MTKRVLKVESLGHYGLKILPKQKLRIAIFSTYGKSVGRTCFWKK